MPPLHVALFVSCLYGSLAFVFTVIGATCLWSTSTGLPGPHSVWYSLTYCFFSIVFPHAKPLPTCIAWHFDLLLQIGWLQKRSITVDIQPFFPVHLCMLDWQSGTKQTFISKSSSRMPLWCHCQQLSFQNMCMSLFIHLFMCSCIHVFIHLFI